MFKKLSFIIFISSALVFAQEEEVQVIGSLIKGTPIDSGSPITILDSADIAAQGNLNIVELIKMVPGSTGMDGESNQFGSNAAEGISNINLRGLGTQRTLVLVNGKRQVTAPLSTGAGRSVNLHDFPLSAISRIEILKEGAAATYGSDAISGVVNFITDGTFEGLRMNVAGKGIPNAQDDGREFSITYGTMLPNDANLLVSFGHQFKPELRAADTVYGLKSYAANTRGGYSSMGNPGTFTSDSTEGAPANVALGFGGNYFLADPGCNAAGGTFTALGAYGTDVEADVALAGFCRYQYTYFDNVQEEQENNQLWLELNGSINDNDYRVEFAYSTTEVPHYATSPSYPPSNPKTNTIPDNHPGMAVLCADYPTFCDALTDENYGGDGTNRAALHGIRTRSMGASGNPFGNSQGAQTEHREYDTYRFAFNFEGNLTDDVQYSTSFNLSNSEGELSSSDTQQSKFLAALWGYGGPDCDAELTGLTTSATDRTPTFKVSSTGAAIAASVVQSTTRPSGCLYVNPLSNAVQQAMQRDHSTADGARMGVNPNYDASVANSTALLRYLTDQRITLSESELMTFDFIAQGTLPSISFDAGEAAWAVGYERRDYNLKTSTPARAGPTATNAMTNIHNGDLYPCLIPEQNETAAGRAACASNPVGLFMFLAPTFDSDQDQDVDSLFAELALPVSDDLDVQLAIRYEDYGTVDSIDPKVVVRYSPTDTVTLRFTGQTTFRAPHPDETSRTRVTALQYVNQTGAFKAVDLTGNTNLEPEEATTYNIGLITDFGTDNWTATLDYYNFEFDNPIINENHQQLANAYGAGGAGKAAIQSQIFGGTNLVNDGSFGVGDIARIQSNYVNGPKTETDGLDLFIKYDTDVGNGTLSTGLEANAILGYSVADYNVGGALVAAAYECAGFFNINNTCRPMPEQKGKGFVNYVDAKHNFYGAVNYISSYYNRRDSGRVAEHRTFDATYTYSMNDSTDLSFSVYNIADKLPPFVNWEMNYDAYTHSPLGRFVKAGFTYRLQ